MTTYTTSDLATRVLRDEGLIGAEETPSGADTTFTIETIHSEVQMMLAKGINIWNGSDDVIPGEYLTALSTRIGPVVARAYGKADDGNTLALMEAAETNLRRIGQSGPTYRTLEATYF